MGGLMSIVLVVVDYFLIRRSYKLRRARGSSSQAANHCTVVMCYYSQGSALHHSKIVCEVVSLGSHIFYEMLV